MPTSCHLHLFWLEMVCSLLSLDFSSYGRPSDIMSFLASFERSQLQSILSFLILEALFKHHWDLYKKRAKGAFSRSWTGQIFFLNFLHENGKLPSNICPDTNLPITGWPFPNPCWEVYCLRSIFGPLKVYFTALCQYKWNPK